MDSRRQQLIADATKTVRENRLVKLAAVAFFTVVGTIAVVWTLNFFSGVRWTALLLLAALLSLFAAALERVSSVRPAPASDKSAARAKLLFVCACSFLGSMMLRLLARALSKWGSAGGPWSHRIGDNTWSLNSKAFHFVVNGAALCLAHSLLILHDGQHVLSFSPVPLAPRRVRFAASVVPAVRTALKVSTGITLAYAILALVIHDTACDVFAAFTVGFVSQYDSRCSAPLVHTPYLGMVFQTLLLSSLLSVLLSLIALLWRVIRTEPVEFREWNMERQETAQRLLAALTAEDPKVRYFAFQDLDRISSGGPECCGRERRALLFQDTSMTLWRGVHDACKAQISSLTRSMQRVVASSDATLLGQQQQQARAAPFQQPSTRAIRATMYQQQIIDQAREAQMGIPQRMIRAVSVSASLLVDMRFGPALIALLPREVDAIVRQISARVAAAIGSGPLRKLGIAPAPALQLSVDVALQDLQLDLWAIRSMGNLIVVSKQEDANGVVQHCNSIVEALCFLLDCLAVTEDLSLRAQQRIPALLLGLHALQDTLSTTLYHMVNSFGDCLADLHVPAKYFQQLESFRSYTR